MSTASLQIPLSNADASWSDWIWSTDHQRYYRCKTTVGGERQFQYAGSSEILRANNAQSVQGSEGIRSLPRSGYDYQARATQHFSLPEDQSSNYHLYGQNSEGSSQENSHLSEDVEQQNEIAPSYYPGYGSYGYSSQPAREGTLTSGPFLGDQQSILSRRQLAVRYRNQFEPLQIEALQVGSILEVLQPIQATSQTMLDHASAVAMSDVGEPREAYIACFAVIRIKQDRVECLLVTTYNGKGTSSSRCLPRSHGILYSTGRPPSPLQDEQEMLSPLFVSMIEPASPCEIGTLHRMTRIDYGTIYVLRGDTLLRLIGNVHANHTQAFEEYYGHVQDQRRGPDRRNHHSFRKTAVIKVHSDDNRNNRRQGNQPNFGDEIPPVGSESPDSDYEGDSARDAGYDTRRAPPFHPSG